MCRLWPKWCVDNLNVWFTLHSAFLNVNGGVFTFELSAIKTVFLLLIFGKLTSVAN